MPFFKSKINEPTNNSYPIRIFRSRGLLYLAAIIQVELMKGIECSKCEKCRMCQNTCKNNKCNCDGSCSDNPCNTNRNNLYERNNCTKETKLEYTNKFNKVINPAKNEKKKSPCNYTITLGNQNVIPLKGVLAELIKKGKKRYCGLCKVGDYIHFFYAEKNGCNFEIKNMLNLIQYDIKYIVNDNQLPKNNITVNANNETIKMKCNPSRNKVNGKSLFSNTKEVCNTNPNNELVLTGIILQRNSEKPYVFTIAT